MGFFSCIVVGLISGWLAERLTDRNHGLLTNLIVGVIGSVIGGFLFSTVMGFDYVRGVNLATIAAATSGAVLFLSLFWRRRTA